MDWKPIDTAPKDGTSVLLWYPQAKQPCYVGRYVRIQHIENGTALSDHEYWQVQSFEIMGERGEPTHWAPIVSPEADLGEAPALQIKIKPGREHALTESTDARDILTGATTPQNKPDILADLDRSISRIISSLRKQREIGGPSSDYFAKVALLCRLADECTDLGEALAPPAFRDTF